MNSRVAATGVLLGVGFGGLVDGIVLHQLLGWHHLLSSTPSAPVDTLDGLRSNTVADGVFHAATWSLAVAGVVLLWRSLRTDRTPGAGRHVLGWSLAGWGMFNLVEGLINHQVLSIHHVREDVTAPLAWDLGFLAFGAALLAAGAGLARTSTPNGAARPSV